MTGLAVAQTAGIVTGDCSQLLPPCWQELHYLIAGAWAGSILGVPIGAWLYRRWD